MTDMALQDYGEIDAEPESGTERPDGGGLVPQMDEAQLAGLATHCLDGLRIDEDSMKDWEETAESGVNLAKMITKKRVWPWEGATNAMYPLIATAALQYNARSYPAICPPGGPVKYATQGNDQGGRKAARAERASAYHNAYLLRGSWEDDTDRLLTVLPIVGAKFRKVWYDPVRGIRSKLCQRVIVNNYCTDWEQMPRKAEEFGLYPGDIIERVASGWFANIDYFSLPSGDEKSADHGGPDLDPHYFIEQHCRYDLDEDGYPEPLIVTIHKASERVCRVVRNYRQRDVMEDGGKIVRIPARDYFVPYSIMQPFDDTFLGIGLGALLGNPSRIINGLINQMSDSGHLASLGGGFLGAGLNLKGGPIRLAPGEFRPVPATGIALRENFVPITFPGPHQVLFQLLGFLEAQAKGLASVNDAITGDIPREQPATTTIAQIEQGLAVYTASYKRIFRAMRREFEIQAGWLAEVTDPRHYAEFHDAPPPEDGQPQEIPTPRGDFDAGDQDVTPVADPRAVTAQQQMGKAQLALDMAGMGLVDPREATARVLDAAGMADTQKLLPKPDPMAQMQQMAAMKAEQIMASLEMDRKQAETEKLKADAMESKADALGKMAEIDMDRKLALLDRYTRLLEVTGRNENERARVEGMAGGPGNAGSNQGAPQGPRRQEAPNLGTVLADGKSQPGPAAGAGIGGSPRLP